MDIVKLDNFLNVYNQLAFRREQILKAVLQDGAVSFSQISTLGKELREQLEREIAILPFTVVKVFRSQDGRAFKALLKLSGNSLIETVLIAPKPNQWSACISSQVGCAMHCAFCATGKNGFKRNLTVDEISSQVLFWRQFFRQKKVSGTFSHLVYMGMGEPLNNWQEVKKSIKWLIDKNLFNFSQRGISVSTAGVTPGIKQFADTFNQVNLAISLHFATDEKRSRYMPINQTYPLTDLAQALKYYFKKSKRKVFIEYVMLAGINDEAEDAADLISYLKSIGRLDMLHVNLIRYNSIGGKFASSLKEKVRVFQNKLLSARVPCTIRKSIGDDIKGACGQLAGRRIDKHSNVDN